MTHLDSHRHPTFLVIGAQKAGTTWLQKNLSEHPQIFSPDQKEIHYFDKKENYAKGPDWYRSHFAGRKSEIASGEYTPNYLWKPATEAERAESDHIADIAAKAAEFNPHFHWIAVLRDPVERAISAYYHHIRAGRVTSGQRIRDVWDRYGIRSMGNYPRSLKSWMDAFPAEQGKVLLFETDILKTPETTLREIYTFLGVNPDFRSANLARAYNPRNSHFLLHLNHRAPLVARVIQKFWPSFGQNWERFQIHTNEDEIKELRAYFADEVAELQDLLKRDLPWEGKTEEKASTADQS